MITLQKPPTKFPMILGVLFCFTSSNQNTHARNLTHTRTHTRARTHTHMQLEKLFILGYASVPAIIAALKKGVIQGALLDTYIAGEFQDQLQDYKLQEILEHVFVYGVVLARDAERLEKELRTYLERKQSKIYNTISKVVKPLKVSSFSTK